MTSVNDAPAIFRRVNDLIDQYWDLAYAAGQENRTHDTANGDEQRTRSAIAGELAKLERMLSGN